MTTEANMSLYVRIRNGRVGTLLHRLVADVSFWRGELNKAKGLRGLPVCAIEESDSVAQLQQVAALHPLHGFNGQVLRAAYLAWLYKQLGCTSFLETGTRWGYTANTARRLFKSPVYSVELIRKNYWHAALLTKLARHSGRGVHLQRGDSRAALRKWLRSDTPGERPMIYLDAHFFEDHPLVTELKLCVARGHCVVVIDDFKVPFDAGFGWDTKQGFEVAFEAIHEVLPKERVRVFFPAHSAISETGKRRGACVLLIDLVPPPSGSASFPGTLFSESRDWPT